MNEYGSAQQKVMVDFEKKLSKDHLTLGQIKVGEVARPEILAVIDNQPVIIQQLEEYVAQKKSLNIRRIKLYRNTRITKMNCKLSLNRAYN